MKRGIDNGLLLSDLDANNFVIRNLESIDDPQFVTIDDPRLTDARNVLPGSVITEDVSEDAAIDQSKLQLDGDIPLNYLGQTEDKAAPGDVVLYKSTKNASFGYGGLGLDGKLPSGTVPTVGTGSVTDIDVQFPESAFTVVPAHSGTDRVFDVYWTSQNPETFLGNMSGAPSIPTFMGAEFPITLIPNIDGSKITSGVFPVGRVPIAQPVGGGHAPGLVPEPGSDSLDPSAQPANYLARDLTWKVMQRVVSYQPQLPTPSITVETYIGVGLARVLISESTAGCNLFFGVNGSPFIEMQPSDFPFEASVGDVVTTYAAKIGYNNSDIYSYTIPPTPTG